MWHGFLFLQMYITIVVVRRYASPVWIGLSGFWSVVWWKLSLRPPLFPSSLFFRSSLPRRCSWLRWLLCCVSERDIASFAPLAVCVSPSASFWRLRHRVWHSFTHLSSSRDSESVSFTARRSALYSSTSIDGDRWEMFRDCIEPTFLIFHFGKSLSFWGGLRHRH